MAITIKPTKSIQEAIDSFDKPIDRKQIASAINETAKRIQPVAVSAVLSSYTINQDSISKKFYFKKATQGSLVAEINARSERFNFGSFDFSGGIGPSGKVKPKIKIKIKSGSSPEILNRAFLWNGLIIERKGRKRYRLKDLQSVSLPQMLNNVRVKSKIQAFSEKTLDRNLVGVL